MQVELTTGFWASVGIPELLITQAGRLSIAEELRSADLAQWDDDLRYGRVLKAKAGLWDMIRAESEMTAC
ncbi:hypothetical protein KKG44_01840 [Patescibacteria group bacterium]|nr:hypothetical protein [Patescibacteria group bacterium]MBU2459839.1 hypothetical protein [Patescibacteria group bacterium]